MKAEYIPPKEDIILQNEAPTEMYILVTGAVVRATSSSAQTLFSLLFLCVFVWGLILAFVIILMSQDLIRKANGVEQVSGIMFDIVRSSVLVFF